MKQGLGGLEDLHVSGFRLLDRLVIFVACLGLANQALVHLLQPIREDGELFLDLGLVFLLLQDLAVQLLTFLTEIFDRLHELVVVVLQGGSLRRHVGKRERKANEFA